MRPELRSLNGIGVEGNLAAAITSCVSRSNGYFAPMEYGGWSKANGSCLGSFFSSPDPSMSFA